MKEITIRLTQKETGAVLFALRDFITFPPMAVLDNDDITDMEKIILKIETQIKG